MKPWLKIFPSMCLKCAVLELTVFKTNLKRCLRARQLHGRLLWNQKIFRKIVIIIFYRMITQESFYARVLKLSQTDQITSTPAGSRDTASDTLLRKVSILLIKLFYFSWNLDICTQNSVSTFIDDSDEFLCNFEKSIFVVWKLAVHWLGWNL